MDIRISIYTKDDQKRLQPREAFYESSTNCIIVMWQLVDQLSPIKNFYSRVGGGYQVSETVYLPNYQFEDSPKIYHAIFGGECISTLQTRYNQNDEEVSHNLVVTNSVKHQGEAPIPIESWDDYYELRNTLQLESTRMLINFTHPSSIASTSLNDCYTYLDSIEPEKKVDPEDCWYDQHYETKPVEDDYKEFMDRYEESKMQIPERLTGQDAAVLDANLGTYHLYYILGMHHDSSAPPPLMHNTLDSDSSPKTESEKDTPPGKWKMCTIL